MNSVPHGAQPGAHLTRQPAPRVLVHLSHSEIAEPIAEKLREFVPTVKVIESPDDVNLTEWDVLITAWSPINEENIHFHVNQWDQGSGAGPVWGQRYPENLCLLLLMGADSFGRVQALDAFPPKGQGSPDVVLLKKKPIIGSHIRESEGLPDGLANLVRQVMVPAVKERDRHTSIVRDVGSDESDGGGLPLRPFLFGPEDCILAASYPRSDQASVWIVPVDIPNIPAWLREALREWHELYPARFPAIPDWDTDPKWKSAAELELIARKDQVESEILAQVDKMRAQLMVLDAELDVERRRADAYERALLTADGEVLERAVQRALEDLGFEVTNMDEVWPEGQRREDLRVRIPGDSDWVAIVEVKGYTKGARETELFGTGRWVESFILDEQRRPSARWFVTNHNRKRAPAERGQPFANKPEHVTSYAASDGLVIDTVTLFEALRIVQSDPARRDEIRDHIVAARGLLGLP